MSPIKVFVTGGSGHIGSNVIKSLVAKGHTVTALARSDKAADIVSALGAAPVRGTHTDLAVLTAAAAEADAVVHLAFNHDAMFSGGSMDDVCAEDRAAIAALAAPLVGTGKALSVASGVLGALGPDETAGKAPQPRLESELMTQAYAKQGIHSSVVRLAPIVHGEGKEHYFLTSLIQTAKAKGVSAYIGEGTTAWAGCHVSGAAELFVLAVTTRGAPAGAVLNGIDEGGFPTKEIAEYIGKRLDVPTKSVSKQEAFGHWPPVIAWVMSEGIPVTNEKTKAWLGWKPSGPGLFEDLEGYSDFQ